MSDRTLATSQVVGRPSYSEVPLQYTYVHILERSRMLVNIPAAESDSRILRVWPDTVESTQERGRTCVGMMGALRRSAGRLPW